jgi:hypothetical protein
MPRPCHASISAKGLFFNQIKELPGAAQRSAARRPSVKFFDIGLTRNWTKTCRQRRGARLQRPMLLDAARPAVCFRNDRRVTAKGRKQPIYSNRIWRKSTFTSVGRQAESHSSGPTCKCIMELAVALPQGVQQLWHNRRPSVVAHVIQVKSCGAALANCAILQGHGCANLGALPMWGFRLNIVNTSGFSHSLLI